MSPAALRKLGVVALAVVGGIVGAEAYLRLRATFVVSRDGAILEHDAGRLVRYTPKGKRLVPNAHVVIRNHYLSKKDVAMDVNSLGFRDVELAAEKSPGELRILALGDSITWSDYLQADEVYVERAQRSLSESLPGRHVEVVNAGVGDVGLKEELDLLEERGLALAPDVVAVGFYLNDSRPPWGFPAEIGHPGWLRRRSLLVDRLYRAAKLQGWVRRQGEQRLAWIQAFPKLRWADDEAEFRQLVSLARYDWGAAWTDEAWVELGGELDRLKALSQRHAFAVTVIGFPVSFQVYARFLDDAPQRRLASESAARGFAFLDLLPLLRARAGEDPDLFFDQCHPREAANELIGAELARFLRATYAWR
jgi:lysophospholipase L1-like esterase